MDEKAISAVLAETFNQSVTSAQVLEMLRRIVRRISGEVLRDMVSYRLNLLFRPQDFSMGSILRGESIVDGEKADIESRLQVLSTKLQSVTGVISRDLGASTTQSSLKGMQDECTKLVREAANYDDKWKTLFPGKHLLDALSKEYALGKPVVLQNTLIKYLADNPERIPGELLDIVGKIDAGVRLT